MTKTLTQLHDERDIIAKRLVEETHKWIDASEAERLVRSSKLLLCAKACREIELELSEHMAQLDRIPDRPIMIELC
jgi:hypothetical protein